MFNCGMYSEKAVISELTSRSVKYLSKFIETWPNNDGKNYSEIIVRNNCLLSVIL